jgi:hypothetical protein
MKARVRRSVDGYAIANARAQLARLSRQGVLSALRQREELPWQIWDAGPKCRRRPLC